MIKVKDLVPEIYYKKSRDFQFIGRTYEVLFNYLKTEIDLMINSPLTENTDVKLLQLVAKTLGFESKHDYNVKDLKALCSSFMKILKHKGTTQAVEDTIQILLNVQNIKKDFEIVEEGYNLSIYLPSEIKDIVLLEDVFNYILPTGFTYTFIYASFTEPKTTNIDFNTNIKTINVKNTQLSQVTKPGVNDIRPSKGDASNDYGLTYVGKVFK